LQLTNSLNWPALIFPFENPIPVQKSDSHVDLVFAIREPTNRQPPSFDNPTAMLENANSNNQSIKLLEQQYKQSNKYLERSPNVVHKREVSLWGTPNWDEPASLRAFLAHP
jgi:hypothetical protein